MQSFEDLNDTQMEWRQHSAGHTIFELLYHVAGAEHYWASRLKGKSGPTDPFLQLLDRAVFEGFLRDGPTEFGPEYRTKAKIVETLCFTYTELEPILRTPNVEQRQMPLTSPIGDAVTGEIGMIRVAQHAAYHTGQIWTIRMDPRFPAA